MNTGCYAHDTPVLNYQANVTTESDRSQPPSADAQRSEQEQRQLVAEITTLFEQKISFNEFLGFRIDQLEPGPVRINFQMRPELIGHYLHGRLHGGVIASVLDVAGGLAVMMGIAAFHPADSTLQILERFSRLATIDLRVDYLRQGIGSEFTAVGEVVRLGRRVAVCSMRLSNDQDSLIATGNASYIVS
ncbi:thioesterase family protein [Granulosicoccus antarcticus]|uniref:Thioesterase domain-containing protein n=1 Tax=Granulosicoccus antarcticus IMCC3135 TaxID=1192854 RepID=A0A2Z2NX65_9GAMM|nr:thioesterase family protein [Granulosicoccus antarcticus]ASJ74348.1 hypothetical protein IMCC3135_21355 [Granulosicoccus antarcticus IMCC3135]